MPFQSKLLTGLTVLLSTAVIGCQTIPLKKITVPQNNKPNPTMQISASESFLSDTVANIGYRFGRGPTTNTYLGANLEQGRVGVTGFTWLNYSLPDSETVEQDYGLTGNLQLTNSINIHAGAQYWSYTLDGMLCNDFVGNFRVNYSKKGFDLGFKTLHLFDRGGTLYIGTAGKTISLTDTLSVTPNIKSVFAEDFYGTYGFSYLTPGISANLGSIGPINIGGFLNYQKGLTKTMPDVFYGGLVFEYNSDKISLNSKK